MTSTELIPPVGSPPNAQDSEREVLSAAVWRAKDYSLVEAQVSAEDFWHPMHREIWQGMTAMLTAGTPIEPITVMNRFQDRGTALATRVVEICSNQFAGSANLEWHLRRIEEASIARNLQEQLMRGHQRAVADWDAGDLGVGALEIADEVIDALRIVQGMRTRESETIDFLDLVRRVIPEEDWVVPDLIARGERCLLTAAEGWGKSTLIRQMAACIAAGLHPFELTPIPARRVLVYDAENPASINTVEWGGLEDRLANFGQHGFVPERGQLQIREIGPCNLLQAKEASHFYDVIDQVRPDIIFVGPLYQLFEGNPNDEEPAKKLARVLDRGKAICNSALVIEAHTPHQEQVRILRPFGASLWKRWPEFGLCLHDDGSAAGQTGQALADAMIARSSDLTPWRGSRSAGRHWPFHLAHGANLPWEVVRAPAIDPRFGLRPPEDVDEPDEEPPPPDLQEAFEI